MIIGVAKEIKNQEYRVAAVPSAVLEMVRHGHTVYVEKDAGTRAGFPDVLNCDAFVGAYGASTL